MMPEIITVSQAAKYLQVSPITIYRMIDAGKLPAAKIGRVLRIRMADLDEYLRRLTEAGNENAEEK